MYRPIHFEIPSANPEAAIKFYGDLFGWKFQSWGGGPMEYWLVDTGDASQPGIQDAMVEKAVAAGGQIALPKMPVPGVGWLAYVKDLDGHIFGLMQSDPEAK
ncbi:MAG: VOC family protein [Bryobacter sp.]|nr:VOC family protein [Bryobacter sp.]